MFCMPNGSLECAFDQRYECNKLLSWRATNEKHKQCTLARCGAITLISHLMEFAFL